jgi:nicotinate dehydrogenase subunit A
VSGSRTWSLTVNDRPVEVQAADDTSLLHVLRHEFQLSGPRFGCGVGLCGACFVLIDGKAAPACDTPIWSVDGKDVVTVEGLGTEHALHPVQEAFLAGQAAQCGFCVSGVLVSAAALLADNPTPDEGEVVAALDRNLCRCGVQRRMVAAVLRAAESRDS